MPEGGALPLRVVVADDEPLALAALVRLLAERGIVPAATCGSGAQALEAIATLCPDVVFLDIRMPGLDGFAVIEQLKASPARPQVVFVTAFDRYAVDAFRVRALDYLLKPVYGPRLDEALARVRERIAAGQVEQPDRWLRTLLARSGTREHVVRVEDIVWIEADLYYARLHVAGRSHLIRERMHILERQLDPAQFIRVHRSAIVNVDHILQVRHPHGGEHELVLDTGLTLRVSRSRWSAVRARLGRGG